MIWRRAPAPTDLPREARRDGYFNNPDEPHEARRAIALTLIGLWWETVLRAFWPLLSILSIGLAALALGAIGVLPGQWPMIAAGLWVGALTVALAWGVARFQRPQVGNARDRIDAELPGAPLSALRDHMALGGDDTGAAALWRAHQARMRAVAAQATAALPDAGLRRRDPFAVRLMALTALAMALLFGGGAQMGQGLSAVAATWRPAPGAPGLAPTDAAPGWEGWAKPPAYTRRPTIYLNALPPESILEVPEGTRFAFRLYGEGAAVQQDIGADAPDTPADAPEFTATHDGNITVAGLSLPVRVLPDDGPTVTLGPVPERRADGRLVQDFAASDDNGVERGQADITLDLAAVGRRFGLAVSPEPRPTLTLDLPLPGAGLRRDVKGRLSADLSRHPWANLPVVMQLRVTDGIDQLGQSGPVAMVLPGRRFFDPVAAALVEMRRDLLWSRNNAVRTAQLLRAIRWQPEATEPEFDAVLTADLTAAIATLEAGPLDTTTRDELSETLWQAAVRIEDGGLNDALARMRQAQEKLSEAIRNGASRDEIQKLMDELKAATDAYTDMLAERGEDPAAKFDRSPRDGQSITGDQIQQMMDEIQRLMNEGRMAEAQELLQQFNRMMDNLQVTQGQGGEGRAGPSRPMQRLTDTLKEQQKLADEAMRQAQDNPFGLPRDDPNGPDREPTQEDGAKDGESLADRQRALREDLGRQRGLLPGRGTPEGQAAGRQLDDAGRAMQDAEQVLRDGDPGGALERQADAIAALREGMRALSDLQQAQSGGQDGDPQQGQEGSGSPGTPGRQGASGRVPQTDPLGRDTGGQGGDITTGDPLAEGSDPNRRARDLQDEIRRRSGDRDRSRDERDYLGRLLDRF